MGGHGTFLRDVDAEAKILEQTFQMTGPETKGTLRLFTERDPCSACSEALANLRKYRPNLKIEVYWKGGSMVLPKE